MNELFEKEIQLRVEEELKKILADPQLVIKAYEKELSMAKLRIAEYKPKAIAYDICLNSESLFEISEVAKIVNFKNVGQKKLFKYLRNRNVLRSNNQPYQRYVDAELFKIVEKPYKKWDEDHIYNMTYATQKGIDYIIKLLKEDGYELNKR